MTPRLKATVVPYNAEDHGAMRQTVMLMSSEELSSEVVDFRSSWDPLHDEVSPHVTVVFPHAPTAFSALEVGLRIASGLRAMEVSFSEPEVDRDYLYLPVAHGANQIVALAEHLKALANPGDLEVTTRPHMTIGRNPCIRQAVAGARRLLPLQAVLDLLVIEQYGDDDVSIPVFTHRLGAAQAHPS